MVLDTSTPGFRRLGKGLMIGSACIVVLIGVVFLISSSDFFSEKQKLSLTDNVENSESESLLSEQSSLVVENSGDDLLAQTKKFNEKLVEASRYVLVGNGVDLKVSSAGKKGVIKISGYMTDYSKLQQIIQSIQIDVDGVDDLINSVVTPETILNEFNELLLNKQLDTKVSLGLANKNSAIRVRGTTPLTLEEYDVLNGVILPLMTSKYSKMLHFVSSVPSPSKKSTQSNGFISVKVRDMVMDPMPQITLDDGNRYREGDSPFPNWIVSKIYAPLVLFESVDEQGRSLAFCSLKGKCLIPN